MLRTERATPCVRQLGHLFSDCNTPEKVTAASGIVVYALAERELIDPKSGQPIADMRKPPIGSKVRPRNEVAGLIAVRVNKDATLTVEKLPGITDPKLFAGFGANAKTYVR